MNQKYQKLFTKLDNAKLSAAWLVENKLDIQALNMNSAMPVFTIQEPPRDFKIAGKKAENKAYQIRENGEVYYLLELFINAKKTALITWLRTPIETNTLH